jgi:hypothetical protein
LSSSSYVSYPTPNHIKFLIQSLQLVLFQSDPFEASWKGGGRLRFDSAKLGLAQVGSSIALDVMVLCFPLPVISRLQLQTKKKWAVGVIFWLGSFCVLAAIVRMILLNQSIHMVLDSVSFSQVCTYPSYYYTDFPQILISYVVVQWKNFVFMILEPNCSIIAACLPCYGPLFKSGKAIESILRSVRSVFSLRSQGSGGSGIGYNKFGHRGGLASEPQQAAESQIELQQNKDRVFANAARVSHGSEDEMRIGEINVTRDVQIVSH